MMALSGSPMTIERFLLAQCVDKLANLVWMLSEDGSKGRNAPQSMVAIFRGDTRISNAKDNDLITYSSPEEFEAAMKKYER